MCKHGLREHNGREINLFKGDEYQRILLRGGDAQT